MSERSNRSGKSIIIIIIAVLVLAGGAWYFFKYKPEQEVIEKARLEQLAKAKAEQEGKELAIQQKAKYDKLIEDGDVEFGQENWEIAQSLYSEASSLFPDQQYPQNQLALVNAKLDEMDVLASNKANGIVEVVSSRIGRFFVIVSSSVDDDLAMDYARELANDGKKVKIIEHDDGKHLFYRVSLGDFASREQAVNASTSFTAYGNGVWVLKY
jgi:hypothetical protein